MDKFSRPKKEGKDGKDHHTRGPHKIDLDTQFSKTLSWILRHGAKNMGILDRDDGFVPVDKVLATENMQSFKKKPGNFSSVEKIMEVVEKDEKQRYALVTFDDILYIRANQGHSFPVPELQLKPVKQKSDIPSGIAIHGTFSSKLPLILQSGLKKMNRTHIHFAIGLPEDEGAAVKSGIRSNVDILIYLNIDKVLQDGIPLFLSANNVVLCPGKNDGTLPVEYFEKILNRKTNEEIPIPKSV